MSSVIRVFLIAISLKLSSASMASEPYYPRMLLGLPAELVAMVSSTLQPMDVVALACTNKEHLNLFLPCIERYMAQTDTRTIARENWKLLVPPRGFAEYVSRYKDVPPSDRMYYKDHFSYYQLVISLLRLAEPARQIGQPEYGVSASCLLFQSYDCPQFLGNQPRSVASFFDPYKGMNVNSDSHDQSLCPRICETLIRCCVDAYKKHPNSILSDICAFSIARLKINNAQCSLNDARIAAKAMCKVLDVAYYDEGLLLKIIGILAQPNRHLKLAKELRDSKTVKQDFSLILELIDYHEQILGVNLLDNRALANILWVNPRSLFNDTVGPSGKTQRELYIERHLEDTFGH